MVGRCAALLFAATLVTAAGCATKTHSAPSSVQTTAASAPASSNGRSIFQTGRDSNGTQIVAQHPPPYASCAACHRANGSGGMHLPGGAVSADLRHKALVTDMKPPYTLATVERAVATGVDNQGKPLDAVMPRWKLSARDLHDVAQYVMTQLK
jgi:mono/diheme cytochrome c family protein